jgi:SAM-dependent methyltransferase
MDFSQLMQLAAGHAEARIVQTAVELRVFEAFARESRTAKAVATELSLEPAACELLLNALAALKLLNKTDEMFSLAPSARQFLLEGSPQYLGGMIRFESALWRCWEELPQAIRSGKPARPADMYQANPDETEVFIGAMDSLVKARGDVEALASVLDWQGVEEMLDVGAGPATYPIGLCRRFPRLRATIFDLPATLKITERRVRDADLRARIRLIAGDYRVDPIPGNYDLIFLSNIIHGENAAVNEALMRKVAGSLKPAGRLVIKDHILDESRAEPPVGAIFSMLMLLTTAGGRCYSLGEIRGWMERAGLSRVEEITLPAPLSSSLVVAFR